MARIGVLGALGKMGAAVCQAVRAVPDLELVAAVDPAGAGEQVAPGLVVGAELAALRDAGVEVAIDFTHASAAFDNLSWCADNGVHAVSGTTGLSEETVAELARRFGAPGAPNAVIAPNFAITAVLLVRLAELAAPHLEGVEVIELHHDQKRDAPSGTAIETANRIAAARAAAGVGPFAPDPTEQERLPGARGARGAGGIAIHAVRLPGLVAHEEVIFGAVGQSLTIRQDSYDRRSFMPGVLLAARRVAATPGLTYGLEPLLGL
ncbi:MAG: 4-hydroxy-tetrahydrodipicolinate reductase [Actinomycetota bacterium]|nr:4-hydroxy-tetrahydrodipicolinate reductase [Actinomycetota bacterium]